MPYISYALSENLYSNKLLNLEELDIDKNIIDPEEIETNIQNRTIEDIRYEELLKKYMENRNTEELIQISTFFDQMDKKIYEGRWFANGVEGLTKYFGIDANEGDMDLTFLKFTEFNRFITQSTTYRLRLLKDNFIDNWIEFQGFSLTFTNITFKNNTLSASYSSFMNFGELFERKGGMNFCDGTFTMSWKNRKSDEDSIKNSNIGKNSKNPNENKFYIQYLNGTFKTNCNVDIKFELSLADDSLIKNKILNYSIVFSMFWILQIINTLYLTKKINESNAFSNGVFKFFINFLNQIKTIHEFYQFIILFRFV